MFTGGLLSLSHTFGRSPFPPSFPGPWFPAAQHLSLAVVYAALILHDDGLEITAEKLVAITKAAGITVEPYWPALFAKLFAKKSIGDLIASVEVVAVPPPAAAAAAPAAAAAAPKKEEKKEESEEEDMGFSLFD
ncbi:MAG: hypothetical protein WDW38_001024 [Sanguina aurantia]